MAGERTKDLTKIAITISPLSGSRRTLTALYDFDPGEGPEKLTKREPDLGGNTYLQKKEDKSRVPSITVKVGTQDEKFLDNLESNTISFDINVVDNSSSIYPKQYTGKECYITKSPPAPHRDGDNRTYEIMCSNFKTKQI